MGTSQIAEALRAAKPAPRRRIEDIFVDDPKALEEAVAAYKRGVMLKDIARYMSTEDQKVTDDMVRAWLVRVGAKT